VDDERDREAHEQGDGRAGEHGRAGEARRAMECARDSPRSSSSAALDLAQAITEPIEQANSLAALLDVGGLVPRRRICISADRARPHSGRQSRAALSAALRAAV